MFVGIWIAQILSKLLGKLRDNFLGEYTGIIVSILAVFCQFMAVVVYYAGMLLELNHSVCDTKF